MTHEQFTQIYLPFSGKMYALAYNLLRNRDEARDCVQDAYAELWNKRDTIEPDKPPLALVLTMVRNNCLDRLKSRSTKAPRQGQPTAGYSVPRIRSVVRTRIALLRSIRIRGNILRHQVLHTRYKVVH